MITSIFLQNLRNGEFLQLLRDILSIILKNDPDNLQIRKAYDFLLNLIDESEKLFKISTSSPITQQMMDLDLRRNNAITGISILINGFGYSINPVLIENAKILSDHLNRFGIGIARDNLQSKTTTIRNIVNDYNTKEDLQQSLTVLYLDEWKIEMETSNNAYSVAYVARAEEIGLASPEKLNARRTALNSAYYSLRDKIDAHFTLTEGSEPYASLTQTINAVITQYNRLLNGRGGKGGDTPPDVPPTNPLPPTV
jgi:hypothetical protein